ncbi:MAG: hypothetical protein Q9213_000718 [Squamulea squamosa]
MGFVEVPCEESQATESEGPELGRVNNFPPGIELGAEDIQPQLSRRRPGQSALSTPRNEKDQVQIQSGIEKGYTLGTPICLLVPNEDQRPHDYNEMDKFPRPSHADFTYQEKYGIRASSGGGRSSARETVARVAAGAVADKCLSLTHGVEIVAFVSSVGDEYLYPHMYSESTVDPGFARLIQTVTRQQVDDHLPVRCPEPKTAERMAKKIADYRDKKDSIGGCITCVVRNCPIGLGEPAFDKLEAVLAHAMLSIPSTKAFEIGSGFHGCEMPGSIHNDPFMSAPPADPSLPSLEPSSKTMDSPRLTTRTNNSGGVQGGISNGSIIYFRVGFKPPATIGQAQQTADFSGIDGVLEAKGRHDPAVVPRAVPIVEAMTSLVLLDALLEQLGREGMRSLLPSRK